MEKTMNEITANSGVLNDIRTIIEQGRQQAYAAAGQAAIVTYWNVGRRIVEEEQQGKERAQYGKKLISNLANAQNQKYPTLEKSIESTYVEQSQANLNKSAYDSYVKAFRWASNRLDKTNGGVIGFVTNGAWIDANGLDGMRKCFEKEFSSIYVFNLRGNQRTSGELSRKEGGKIFGSGSRTPIAITILVKKGEH